MPLTPGSRLGPYEVVAPIGAGGMGEVYRARDTRLDRTVAIKVLPAHLASKPELRQRLEREAKAISSLNHPHICTLYDVGREGDIDFLVMEYLEGETLAERLIKGPLPPDQLLRYAVEIADALDKAHRNGVTHRDLKPGNVMITKNGTKLLDFGLAKSAEPQADMMTADTLTKAAPLTQQGTILGTFQYMAPEQLEGKEADARSDIHAFGAMLFEMATGRRAFSGKSQASLIVAIMESEPPAPSSISPLSPPALDRVVKICLAKDPDERWQTAHDLKLQLAWIAEGGAFSNTLAGLPAPVMARRKSRETASWVVAGVFVLTSLLLGGILLLRKPERLSPTRFALALPDKSGDPSWPALSPDGKFLVVQGASLWVRSLNSLTFQPLPGTEGAFLPFWSPDSQWIAFFMNGKLQKIPATGGPVQIVCEAPSGQGGSWFDKAMGNQGVIVFAPRGSTASEPGEGLSQVSAAGGEPKPFTKLDSSHGERIHRLPQFLPDGRVIYQAINGATSKTYVVSAYGQAPKLIPDPDGNARYAAGYLLSTRQGTLLAQPFDERKLERYGEAVPLTQNVLQPNSTLAFFSASPSGLVYIEGTTSFAVQLTWLDRNGRPSGLVGAPDEITNPRLSPDGTKLAVGIMDPQVKTRDLWIFDLVRGTKSRFTSDKGDDLNPVWSVDGSKILFTSNRKGHRDIYQKAANGLGADEPVFESSLTKAVTDWSADGRYAIYDDGVNTASSVFAVPLSGERQPVLVARGRAGALSPDGRWIAYSSYESGRWEINVQSFPQLTGKWQVSVNGGEEPAWRRDGKELYFLEGSKMMAAEMKPTASGLEPGIPKLLFDAHVAPLNGRRNRYVVTGNGQRFLVSISPGENTAPPIVVMLNWAEALGKK